MNGGLARRAVFRLLGHVRGGALELTEVDGRRFGFGDPGAGIRARVAVAEPRAYRWMLRGSTGLGEGYVDGLWDSDDLVELTRIAARSMEPLDRWRRRLHPLLGRLQRLSRMVPRNTRAGATRNISAHYDLGNALFESFLDSRLIYSCARFDDPGATLDEAQLAKLELICDQLELDADDHLLEIGTGWGGLAIHAARTRGCRVTTATISREQHAYATERVREQGLGDRVEVLLRDYRDLRGRFDKLASVEMIEAVGWQYFDLYFSRCAELLRPGGAFFCQAIVIGDAQYEYEKASRSFANTHVFPGGCLPSEELIAGLAAANGIPVSWSEEISADYARTLELWRRRFNESWPTLRERGYDERFRRLWNFYLAFSEGGFRERRIRDLQILCRKPGSPAAPKESRWSSRSSAREPASLSS